MSETETILLPDAILPMDGTLLTNTAVVIADGKIAAVGLPALMRERYPAARVDRLAGVLLPGLINAHCHLELSYLRGKVAIDPSEPSPSVRFTRWVSAMMQQYPAKEVVAETISAAVRAGAEESLRFGVTTVGDISRHAAVSRAALKDSPLKVISFGEVMGLGVLRENHQGMLAAAMLPGDSPGVRVGISPHAPYTVEQDVLRAAVRAAIGADMPVAMHLAELSDEGAFLRDQSGALGRDWPAMARIIDAEVPSFEGGPIAWARAAGLLSAPVPVLLAHVNYVDDEEMELLAAGTAAVVYCPRTRTAFGHDAILKHRWREMMALGVTVCLGTDSLASNPDLNPLAEARHVLETFAGAEPLRLLGMITALPARALGLEAGQIRPGMQADLALFAVAAGATASATARGLIEAVALPVGVWADGVRLEM